MNTTSFDIKVRKFVYSGIPEESTNTLHNKAILQRKQMRDRIERDEMKKGCHKFMYRNNKAFQFEKEMLTRGGDLDNTPFSSFGDITKPRSIALESFVASEPGVGQIMPMQTY